MKNYRLVGDVLIGIPPIHLMIEMFLGLCIFGVIVNQHML